MPIYNTSELAEKLLQKLVNQKNNSSKLLFDDTVQIIAINDGSTEDMSWLALYTNEIYVVHTANGGAASAKNIGLGMATGEYIAFVDSDDDVSDDFIENILNLLEEEPGSDIYYFKCTCEDGSIGYHEPCAWGKVVRRKYIGGARFDENYNIGEEDTLFLPLAKAKPPRVVYHDAILYHYRWSANPDSLMKRFWRGEFPKLKND